MDEAEFLLESAIANLMLMMRSLKMDYIQVLRRRQKFEASLVTAQELAESRF